MVNFFHNLRKTNLRKILMFIIVGWLIMAFLIYPNINLLFRTFIQDGNFSFSAFERLFSSRRAVNGLINSFILAVSMIITVNIVGTFIVLVTEYFDIKGARILKVGFMTTLVFSGIILVAGYKFMYGENGFVENLITNIFPAYSAGWFKGYVAVLFIMTFACTSYHMIFLRNAVRSLDQGIIEAAKNMGASQFTIVWKILLPTLKPAFFAITILTFITGLNAVSAPLVVGGNSFQTINPIILQFSKTQTSRDIAALMAIILGLSTFILLYIMNRLEKGGNYISISKVKTKIVKQKINNQLLNVITHIFSYLLFVIYVSPLILVLLFSFTTSKYINAGELSFSNMTLSNYQNLFKLQGAIKPYIVSIVYSFAAAIIVVIICFAAARIIHRNKKIFGTFLEFSLLIPWLLPATFIALGLIMAYDLPRPILLNQILIGTPAIMLFAYVIINIPFGLRMIKASLFGLDHSLEESAKSMGASKIRILVKIIIPILLPSILAVIALVFIDLLANYDVSVFLYYPSYTPLGIVIKDATDNMTAQDTKAMMFVYSVVVMTMSTIVLYFVYGRNTSEKTKRQKRG